MAVDFQLKAGGEIQICLEGQGFFLLATDGEQPMKRNLPGAQTHGNVGVFDPMGGEAQMGFQAVGAMPVDIGDLAQAQAGRLHNS